MNALDVGKRLVELCSEGKNREAIEELYADSVDFHEAMDPAGMGDNLPDGMYPNGMLTREQVLKGNDWFFENHEIHGGTIDGPYPLGEQFICFMAIDCTAKVGPMAGQRMEMKEACLYDVKDGKITASRFFYAMPPGMEF